jgi:hypothetical protein
MIAMEQHGGADADGKTADRRDQGLCIVRQRLEKRDTARPKRAGLGCFEEFANIAASTKSPRAAREHDAADRIARPGLEESVRHRRIHRLR